MITLHHCVSARSFRPLWALGEIGLPYELKMMPFPPRVLARSYLDINPLGTVPALFDGAMRFEAPERRQPQVADDYAKWFLARLRTLEPLLANQPFLCAQRFTAADISVGYALLLAQHQRAAIAQHVPATPSPDLGPPEPARSAS
jgi:glutathione S-transferase